MVVQALAWSKSTPSLNYFSGLAAAARQADVTSSFDIHFALCCGIPSSNSRVAGSSLRKVKVRSGSDPFAGCVALVQHGNIRVYTRLHELRIIEIFAGLEWTSSDTLGHLFSKEKSYLGTNVI
jgi:hypothetical protein